jgi:recombination protein RecT
MASPGFIKQLQNAMPKTFSASRLARIALTAMTRTPALENCDQASLARCILDLAQVGLEPDGRHAHLIPFKNTNRKCTECQLIIDYKGYVQLVYRSGMALSIHADVIYEGDDFAVDRGEVSRHTKWEWRPQGQRPEMRGKLRGAYATVRLKGGGEASVVMTKDEIDAIRKRSKSRDNSPWVTDYEEMAKKSVFKRLTKWVPISAEVRNALDADDDREDTIVTSRASFLIGQAMDESQSDENTIDATAEDVTPAWQSSLEEVRILVETAKTSNDLFDIESVWLDRFADTEWREEVKELIRVRTAQVDAA